MVSYSPNGPFVPRFPTAFVPKNAQNFGPRTPRSTADVGRQVTVSPNGEFIPRFPTEFVPKNAQNFTSTAAATAAGITGARPAYLPPDMGEAGAYAASAVAPTEQQPGGTGGGMSGNPIDALFAPMFENLRRQRQQANKRYEANSQQVTNIYGQITGARTQDIGALETAFKRLVDAASTRSAAVNTQIDTAEAARLAGNQAALQSMGLQGLSTSQGDIASQGAALAKQTNTLNAENWQNLLQASGRNAQEIARADVAGYNYAMLEDLGQLRGAREEFAQDLGQQRFELKSKKAQATFEYQQAQQRAAAAARNAQQRAAQRDASAAEKAAADALSKNGPAVVIVDSYVRNQQLNPDQGRQALDAITEFYQNVAAPGGKWTASGAKNALFSAAGDSLTAAQKRAISAVFDETLPKG